MGGWHEADLCHQRTHGEGHPGVSSNLILESPVSVSEKEDVLDYGPHSL